MSRLKNSSFIKRAVHQRPPQYRDSRVSCFQLLEAARSHKGRCKIGAHLVFHQIPELRTNNLKNFCKTNLLATFLIDLFAI